MKRTIGCWQLLAAVGVFLVSRGASAATQAEKDCYAALKTVPAENYRLEQIRDGVECNKSSVYCVDATGYPLPGEERDPRLSPGRELEVQLFGPRACSPFLAVSTDRKQSSATLFNPQARGVRETMNGSAQHSNEIVKLGSTKVTPDENTLSVTIFVGRVDAKLEPLEGITLDVLQPTYFLDVGLLVAFVPEYQEVSTSRAPGLRDVMIREERFLYPSAGITLNLLPFQQYTQPRFSGMHGIGVQFGIGGDFSEIDDEFYLGVLYEIVPGAGLSAGLALIKVESLQPGFESGMLVPSDDVPRDRELAPRFYFGVSLNTHVFQTLLNIGGRARVPE